MKDKSAGRLFCFGYGFSAGVLAARLRGQGFSVAGTCRSEEKAAKLRQEGVEAFIFDGESPLPAGALEGVTHLLISIPPTEKGDPVLRACGEMLREKAGEINWAGYLSTTGVYGDRQGGWVDETTPVDPAVMRSDHRAKAESDWLAFARETGLPLHLFRLSGIYGPGRNQLLGVLNGTARRIIKPGQIFSRIHVEDIAGVLEASMAKPDLLAIYNVCDDEPAPAHEVVAYAADLLGQEVPPAIPFEEANLSPMARSFYEAPRRVSNARIRNALGVTLRYPTYREGLAALLDTLPKGDR